MAIKLSPKGKVIKQRLIELGMSQKELAEQLNMSNNYLTQIVCGYRAGNKYIQMIGDILGVELDSFRESA